MRKNTFALAFLLLAGVLAHSQPVLTNLTLNGNVPIQSTKTRSSPWHWSHGGKVTTLTYADGRTGEIVTSDKLPFTIVRRGLVTDPLTNDILLTLPLGPAAKLVTFGTAGLMPAEKNPGSYMYQAVADPVTRAGWVAGWISSERGNGVMFTPVKDGQVSLVARSDFGKVELKTGKTEPGEWLAIGYFNDVRDGLEAYAQLAADFNQVKLNSQLSGYCTWYAEKHNGASDEKAIIELAEFAAKELKPWGFDYIQIDDMWQKGKRRNGPAKDFTTVQPDGPYRGGMKPVADKLHSLGFVPGLWYMPVAVDHENDYYKGRDTLWAKRLDPKTGKLIPYETDWGGTSLDLSGKDAVEHVKKLTRIITGDWGYRLIKIDGLYVGLACEQIYVSTCYKEDHFGNNIFADPTVSNNEAFRRGLRALRQTGGKDLFVLGCCAAQNMRSLGASYGLVDAMRIGADNGPDCGAGATGDPVIKKTLDAGSLFTGPFNGSHRYFFNGRLWYNDPDPVYLRKSIPFKVARLLASWVGLTGQVIANSDWLPEVPADRIEMFRHILPAHGVYTARPVDMLQRDLPEIWTLTNAQRIVLGFFNWDPTEKEYRVTAQELGLNPTKTYALYDFWGQRPLPSLTGAMTVKVPAFDCLILAAREVTGTPMLLSTSRHLTQGMVDVVREDWNPKTKTLSGKSQKLVPGEAYTLRVWAPKGMITASEFESTTATGEEGRIFSVRLVPTSSTLSWSVRFE